MEDVVPDTGAGDTSHSHAGNSGNRVQRDWIPIVNNRHRCFSRSESNRFLENSQDVGKTRSVHLVGRCCRGTNDSFIIVVPSNNSSNLSNYQSLQSGSHRSQRWKMDSLPQARSSTPLSGVQHSVSSPGLHQ